MFVHCYQEEQSEGLVGTYSVLVRILKMDTMKRLIIILLTCKVGAILHLSLPPSFHCFFHLPYSSFPFPSIFDL